MYRHLQLLFLAMLLPMVSYAYWLPPASNTLVNDYSNILSSEQRQSLEQRLVDFHQQTSNQIVVIITPTLEGDEIISAGQRVAQEWGIGHKEYNNGLLIIIKSKTSDEPDGDVAIVTGYGFEGVFPDVFCAKIIDEQMLPYLASGNYYEAITHALDVILPVAAGEYSYEQAMNSDTGNDWWVGLVVFLVFGIVMYIAYRRGNKNGGNGSSGGSYWGGSPWMGGYGGSSGGFGGFGSSGGFGGFGGFGGGSFGGGGASRRF